MLVIEAYNWTDINLNNDFIEVPYLPLMIEYAIPLAKQNALKFSNVFLIQMKRDSRKKLLRIKKPASEKKAKVFTGQKGLF